MNLKKLTWKKVGKGVGKVLDNKIVKGAAALGLAATGVGAPAAALLMGGGAAASKLAQGKRLTTALKSGAKDGALTYAGMKIIPKVTDKLGGVFNKVPGAESAGEIGLPGGDIAGQGRFRSIMGTAGKFLGGSDGFGADDLLKYGKAAGDAFGAYEDRERFGKMEDMANADYASRAPLREAGMAGLLDESRPDLSSVFAQPEQRYRRVNVGSRGVV